MEADRTKRKRKGLKLILWILSVAVVLMAAFLVRNRYAFGVWNPWGVPNRVECYDRRYYIARTSPELLSGDQKPAYAVGNSDNRTGKELYTSEPKGDLVPVVLYLKLSDGKYQQYILSGGP